MRRGPNTVGADRGAQMRCAIGMPKPVDQGSLVERRDIQFRGNGSKTCTQTTGRIGFAITMRSVITVRAVFTNIGVRRVMRAMSTR